MKQSIRDKEKCFIMKKDNIHQEDITIIKELIYLPNNDPQIHIAQIDIM